MPSIIIDYSYWWLVVIIFVAALYSFILYRKDKNLLEVKNYVLIILRVLRFFTVAILLFLLLKPLFKITKKHTEKPIIAFIQDNSSSILHNKDSLLYKTEYLQNINLLKSDLSSKFETVLYTFGDKIEKTDSIDFKANKTNIAKAIEKISDLYINRNLGAIVLASDGIFNAGKNPNYINKAVNTTIYTILLGDTTEKKDVKIKDVIYNKDVFLGNNFPIEVLIKSSKLIGEKAKVKIINSKKVISEKEISLSKINKLKFVLKAEKKGLARYRVVVETNTINEENTKNNSSEIVVNVIDSRKRILLLANSPHPDIYAIKSSLANNSFYKIDYQVFNGSVNKLKDYDLVIFHQLPSKNKSIINIIEKLKILSTPTMFIVGAQTDVNKFNELNTSFNIDIQKKSFEETAAVINKKFLLYTFDKDFEDYINNLPPVISYFANYTSKAKNNVFFYQKIRNIDTERPLFMFAEQNANRIALISGEGIWRWKVYDYMQNKSFDKFNTLINKTLQYLTANLKDKALNLTYKKSYQTNNEIIINAQFVNKSFELVNTPDLTLQLKNQENVNYNYSFDKYKDKYKLKISGLEKGDYSFNAKLKFAGEIYSVLGNFSVLNKNIESINTVANHKLMKQISMNNNGESFFANEIDDLKNAITQNANITKVNYYKTSLSELINNVWLLVFIVVFISTEWFIRKYSGGY